MCGPSLWSTAGGKKKNNHPGKKKKKKKNGNSFHVRAGRKKGKKAPECGTHPQPA